jgi:hypothetical protein
MAHKSDSGFLGGGYFLGFIGSVLYFIQTATGFWDGVVGVFKALVWPAVLIYHLFRFLSVD